MMSSHCSRETVGFLKKLPALPITAGSGSLARRISQTQSNICCAVVGASGSLLARRHGALIDAHEVVLRPNWLLTKGYETVVGTRTDLNVFFGVEGMVDQFLQARRKLPASLRPIGLITPASDKSVASIMRHMGRERERNRTSTDIFLLSDSVYHRALGSLCAATQQGCEWPRGI